MRPRIQTVVTIGVCTLLAACRAEAAHPGNQLRALAAAPSGEAVKLPGLEYEVLRSGPSTGSRPLRSDDVEIRYVGRLPDGTIFSTSAENGTRTSTFSVRTVIPGFSALVQLMRPGDLWRFKIPAFLGYGYAGRRYTPPETTLRVDIPPNSDLIFDVELMSIEPTKSAS